MSKYILTTIVLTACLSLLQPSPTRAEEALVLENDRLALRFDRKTGTLTALENKLTEETYKISGDEFAVEAVEFRLDRTNAGPTSLELQGETVKAQYQGGGMTIDVTYTLGREHHFAEKQIILTCNQPYKLKNVVLSRVTLPGANVRIVSLDGDVLVAGCGVSIRIAPTEGLYDGRAIKGTAGLPVGHAGTGTAGRNPGSFRPHVEWGSGAAAAAGHLPSPGETAVVLRIRPAK